MLRIAIRHHIPHNALRTSRQQRPGSGIISAILFQYVPIFRGYRLFLIFSVLQIRHFYNIQKSFLHTVMRLMGSPDHYAYICSGRVENIVRH